MPLGPKDLMVAELNLLHKLSVVTTYLKELLAKSIEFN